jgi:acyl-CoA reductase-like NAD-dependent aldehyde dehydrogenase
VVDETPEAGFYQAPTLLRDVPVMHKLAQQEIFGPVSSGYGREKGFEALHGSTTLKTVAFEHD